MNQFQVMLDTLNRKVNALELEFHGSIKVDHARQQQQVARPRKPKAHNFGMQGRSDALGEAALMA